MNLLKILFSTFVVLLLSYSSVGAQNLQIGTIERPPFVMQSVDGEITGFSIELWDNIMKKLNINSDYKIYEVFSEMLDDTKSGEVDLSIANISVTSEREKELDFSNPLFDSGLALMVRSESLESSSFLRSLIRIPAVIFIGVLIILPFVFYKIIPQKRIKKRKYIYIFLYMLIGSSVFSSLYTHHSIQSLQNGVYNLSTITTKQVASIQGSTGERFLQDFAIPHLSYARLDELYESLKMEEVEVIVHDFPILSYESEKDSQLEVVGETFKKEKYGIAYPKNSALKEDINIAILELRSEGIYDTLYQKYFGNN